MEQSVTDILKGGMTAENQLRQLRDLVYDNPSCAAFQLALAKLLSVYRPEEFENRLGELSMYAPTREWLWQFIHQPQEEAVAVESELTKMVQDINEKPVTSVETPKQEEPAKAERIEGDTEFFSETLAQIYIKQMKYDRAIKIFEKLSLKYPEKSVYFADQIRFLRIIIDNNKK